MVSVAEIEAAQTLLRRSDEVSRRDGLVMIDGWGDRIPDEAAARVLLRAMTVAYPTLRSSHADPALRFGHILCRCPRSVSVAEIEGAYLVSAARVRRLLLHVLALRRDAPGVSALSYLIGSDGPVELLPPPAGDLLSPVLDVVSAPDLVPALVHVASRPGWTWSAVGVLEHLVADGRIESGTRSQIVAGLEPVVGCLVTACDQAAGSDVTVTDVTRAERFRLRSLVSLFGILGSDAAGGVLLRVLSSADARVSAMGAAALASAGRPVAPERLDLVARDPEARAELFDALIAHDGLHHAPERWRNGHARAEAELVRWLTGVAELGTAPDEIEHVAAVPAYGDSAVGDSAVGDSADGDSADGDDVDGVVHLFRFRQHWPHWSCARGWMIGAAGPLLDDGTVPAGDELFVSSVYAAEDDYDIEGHLDSILDALGSWPDADGD